MNDEYFEEVFSPQALLEVFNDRYRKSAGKGVDRLNGFQFDRRAVHELATASQKILSGSFRFSPYLEVLKLKGRGKAPRIIGIPTIRDRVVLHQLNKYLAAQFPDCVPRNIAAVYVRDIAADLQTLPQKKTWICTTDIKTFYDHIQRDRLLRVLAKKISSEPALRLVEHALQTPIVPKNAQRASHRVYKTDRGVPQGLAISNILAAIYMQVVDEAMAGYGVRYHRYVDDVLMYGPRENVYKAFDTLKRRLRLRGLDLHSLRSGKSQICRATEAFGYLGYVFNGTHITIRDQTIERFLQSIASKFSDYQHNKQRRLERFKYLDDQRMKEIFLLELNERISGAVKEDRRYGWIAYFNQITDLALLHKLDDIIKKFFRRLNEFKNQPPAELKTLVRSYWEIKYRPKDGYVRDYDVFTSIAEKLKFLVERGRAAQDEKLSEPEIEARFEKYVRHNLAAMHADEGDIYR